MEGLHQPTELLESFSCAMRKHKIEWTSFVWKGAQNRIVWAVNTFPTFSITVWKLQRHKRRTLEGARSFTTEHAHGIWIFASVKSSKFRFFSSDKFIYSQFQLIQHDMLSTKALRADTKIPLECEFTFFMLKKLLPQASKACMHLSALPVSFPALILRDASLS